MKHPFQSKMDKQSIPSCRKTLFNLQNNIFITPIVKIIIWGLAPNTVLVTYNLEIDDFHNFHQMYQRSAVAIDTKLQNTSFSKV